MFLFATLADATQYVNFQEMMGANSEIAFSVFGLPIRWYALAYLAGIFLGYWYLLKLIAQPGAPMARRHADDMIFYAMLGIILGGRLGYVLFYNLEAYIADPVAILRLWDGGMSLHGGVLGVLAAIWYVTRKEKLSFLRFCDYIACVVPFGLFLGRVANFVNGELWGRVTTVPWAIVFPGGAGDLPRHPSQLYEAGLEGLVMMAVLAWFFWRTDARYKPGFLVGMASIIYGISRFAVEFVREPDVQRLWVVEATGLSMGQWLTVPMIAIGLWLVATAKGRRQRVEPVAGTDSIA
ncbi:prolipoprotein diacylglyceryl transferase [Sphingopyxis sp. XHP0097]|uniref:Phosphatidylglycerol--prolipoprotein diacylglyceryl transferase n=1 Tax=Sphingopyxis jiangsuensis TaxID=2871171 RepID=A0ABS7MG92_9SPHN|nr:prolipoprotein diacylglyceryl transferase [Sphingopyxis jiangsuensis]